MKTGLILALVGLAEGAYLSHINQDFNVASNSTIPDYFDGSKVVRTKNHGNAPDWLYRAIEDAEADAAKKNASQNATTLFSWDPQAA